MGEWLRSYLSSLDQMDPTEDDSEPGECLDPWCASVGVLVQDVRVERPCACTIEAILLTGGASNPASTTPLCAQWTHQE